MRAELHGRERRPAGRAVEREAERRERRPGLRERGEDERVVAKRRPRVAVEEEDGVARRGGRARRERGAPARGRGRLDDDDARFRRVDGRAEGAGRRRRVVRGPRVDDDDLDELRGAVRARGERPLEACVEIKSSTRLQCAHMRMF